MSPPTFSLGAERHPLIAHVHRTMVDQIPADARRVVELGCGEGRVLDRVRRHGHADVIGLDLAPQPQVWAGTTNRPALIKGDLGRLPMATASIDAAICLFVYPQIRPKWSALREMSRVIRPGGTLILSMQNCLNPFVLVRKIVYSFPAKSRVPQILMSVGGIEQWMASVGFTVTRRFGLSVPPYFHTRGVLGRGARIYHRFLSATPSGAPIRGIVAVRK